MDTPSTYESQTEWCIEPPEGSPEVDVAPDILFVKVPDRKVVKNRLHFDLRPADQQAQVRRLIELGASRADIGQPDDSTWVVMSDPERERVLPARSPFLRTMRGALLEAAVPRKLSDHAGAASLSAGEMLLVLSLSSQGP